MPRYGCLILDLDGTVVDSHAYTFDAFRYACTPFRAAPTDAEIYAAFGPWERVILGGLVRPDEVEPAYARLQDFYARHAAGLVVHPQMRPLLHDCRDGGVRCGLFTGRGSDSTRLILEALDLAWAFGAVVAGDTAPRPKPSGDGVRLLLRQLGSAAAAALVVGDSRLDLEAAQDAGTAAVLASWYPWSGRAVPGPAVEIAEPDGLRRWLDLRPAR